MSVPSLSRSNSISNLGSVNFAPDPNRATSTDSAIANNNQISINAARDAINAALPGQNATANIFASYPAIPSASALATAQTNSNTSYANVGATTGPTPDGHMNFTARMREFIQKADGSTFSNLAPQAQDLLLAAFDACAPGSNTSVFSGFNTYSIKQEFDNHIDFTLKIRLNMSHKQTFIEKPLIDRNNNCNQRIDISPFSNFIMYNGINDFTLFFN